MRAGHWSDRATPSGLRLLPPTRLRAPDVVERHGSPGRASARPPRQQVGAGGARPGVLAARARTEYYTLGRVQGDWRGRILRVFF